MTATISIPLVPILPYGVSYKCDNVKGQCLVCPSWATVETWLCNMTVKSNCFPYRYKMLILRKRLHCNPRHWTFKGPVCHL